jgi:hypothetical protein
MYLINVLSANADAMGRSSRKCNLRRSPFWACLFVAIILNAGLLVALVIRSAKPLPQPTSETVATSVFTIATNSQAKESKPVNVTREAKRLAPIQSAALRLADSNAAWIEESRASIDASATHFFSYDEVETPARPDTDWNLDPSALDALGIERLVFDVFINDAGEVMACTFKVPASLSSEEKEAISARLRMTALTPAIRAGRAVASFRTIDLFVVASP